MAALVLPGAVIGGAAAETPRSSPVALAAAPDGRTLFVACAGAGRVLVFDTVTRQIRASVGLPASPTGLALSADGTRCYVTCAAAQSRVCVVDAAKGRIVAEIVAGHTAMAPVLSKDGRVLFVCNRFDNEVSFLDLEAGKETRRVKVQREPVAAALTLDGRRLLVANHLCAGRADLDDVAAAISVIDTASGQTVKEVRLPNGSGSLNDIRVSPDGKYAVVTHVLSRFHLPATHVDRGWMNTNAKTLLDLERMEAINTVLLDNVDRGAANPWGAAWSADGQNLVIAHAGTHELSVIDFPALLAKLAKVPVQGPAGQAGDYASASRVKADVPNDLAFLVGIRRRLRLPPDDLGPRVVALIGSQAYVGNVFSDTLAVVDITAKYPRWESIALGPKPTLTSAEKGELYFHDATICLQGWQSCSTCHPGGARMDGLNWDLTNDGIGNPKNTKSLLLAHRTPPAMSMGVRETAEQAVRAGIRNILFTVQPEEVAAAIDDYLKSLKPVPSPYLEHGRLSAAALRGKQLFLDARVGCAACHPPGLFTRLQSYNVGTRGRFDQPTDQFDTPTLVEVWRTAPYLHDGSAATIREVLTTCNHNDAHGATSQLSADQIDDLAAYVLSL